MKILVLGGTRYFGKRLVAELLCRGHDVSIATRGNTQNPFGSQVERLVLDRYDQALLTEVLGTAGAWDLVYDQLCYAPSDAADICQVLESRASRYICTSSMMVYQPGVGRREADFDPSATPLQMGRRPQFSYPQGKRLAEATLFQRATFPVTAVRFPVVLGPDDYTHRLNTELQRIKHLQPLPVSNPAAAMSLISSKEAAAFLAWLVENPLSGPINACSAGEITVSELIAIMEQATRTQASISHEEYQDPFSLFGLHTSFTLNTSKAQKAGYAFRPVREWLPPLIHHLAVQEP